jgi:hypothetical protein
MLASPDGGIRGGDGGLAGNDGGSPSRDAGMGGNDPGLPYGGPPGTDPLAVARPGHSGCQQAGLGEPSLLGLLTVAVALGAGRQRLGPHR